MGKLPQSISCTSTGYISTGESVYGVSTQEIINKLAEYEDAEEEGTLVRLPCALGTECYYANPVLHEVCPSEIIGFEIKKYTNPSLWIEFEYISRWVGRHVHKIREDSAFGKLLFFTKEEAEQTLKEESE